MRFRLRRKPQPLVGIDGGRDDSDLNEWVGLGPAEGESLVGWLRAHGVDAEPVFLDVDDLSPELRAALPDEPKRRRWWR